MRWFATATCRQGYNIWISNNNAGIPCPIVETPFHGITFLRWVIRWDAEVPDLRVFWDFAGQPGLFAFIEAADFRIAGITRLRTN